MIYKKELYNGLKPFLKCKDHTVSNEVYDVLFHEDLEMLVTYPVPENLGKYYLSDNYISHTDSKKSIFDKVYQIVKNYTLQKKLSLINSFNTDEKLLLDIGAGTGDFLKVCKNNGWKTYGVEPSLSARKIADQKDIILKENLSSYSDKKFDVITLWHVLEHVDNLGEYISLLKSLLKEDGVLLVAVPNYKSYDANYYKEHWAAFDVPRHLWHFSQNSISKLFQKVSMNVVKTIPMKFDSFYVSLLSEKYKKGISNVFNAFYRGLLSNFKAKQNSEYSSLIYVVKNSKNQF